MSITKTTELCKVGRRYITYERIFELDEERCKKALQIVLNSKPAVKDEKLEAISKHVS